MQFILKFFVGENVFEFDLCLLTKIDLLTLREIGTVMLCTNFIRVREVLSGSLHEGKQL